MRACGPLQVHVAFCSQDSWCGVSLLSLLPGRGRDYRSCTAWWWPPPFLGIDSERAAQRAENVDMQFGCRFFILR